MRGSRADRATRKCRDAHERLDAGVDESEDSAPSKLARLRVECRDFVARLNVFNHHFVIFVRIACGERSRTILAPPAAAQPRVGGDAEAVYGQGAADGNVAVRAEVTGGSRGGVAADGDRAVVQGGQNRS